MADVSDTTPDFPLPKVGGESYDDVESFMLTEAVGDWPSVLASYPAALPGGCTEEMCAFRDSMSDFDAFDAQVFGVSIDLPFAQNVWIQEHDLGFQMLSDGNHEATAAYDVVLADLYESIDVASGAFSLSTVTGSSGTSGKRRGPTDARRARR